MKPEEFNWELYYEPYEKKTLLAVKKGLEEIQAQTKRKLEAVTKVLEKK